MDTGNFGEEYQIPDQYILKDVLEHVEDREDLMMNILFNLIQYVIILIWVKQV